ncbi:MAG: acyltransferase [Candidatus Electrothrix sp. ATG1]|nr:acyltransferase [Candidatus Electrothrix sp. ATG1]
MLEQIKNVYHHLLAYKKKQYLDSLVGNGLTMGNNVTIMDGCFFDPTHCYLIYIGENCTLAPNVRLIAHDASMKNILGYTRVGKIIIEENCFIGDSVIILPGVTIGNGSVVGAGSVVIKDIPSESVAAGNPCRVLCHRNEYIDKHKKHMVGRKTPYAEEEQSQLDENQKGEIKSFLDSGTGYIR